MTSSNPDASMPSLTRDDMIRRHGSDLTQRGALEDAASDRDWLARANGRLVLEQGSISAEKVPKTLSDAIKHDGKLSKNVELHVFGKWLLRDGAPRPSIRRGAQPGRKQVVETLCCAVHAAEGRGKKRAPDGLLAAIDPQAPTKINPVEPMRQLFGCQCAHQSRRIEDHPVLRGP